MSLLFWFTAPWMFRRCCDYLAPCRAVGKVVQPQALSRGGGGLGGLCGNEMSVGMISQPCH